MEARWWWRSVWRSPRPTPRRPGLRRWGPGCGDGVVVGGVLGSDGDGDSLSYSGSAATSRVRWWWPLMVGSPPPTGWRASAAADAASAADRVDSFSVTVVDGHGGSVSVPVSVVVGAANAAPTGSASVGVPDASSGVVVGVVSAGDADGDLLSFCRFGDVEGAVVLGDGVVLPIPRLRWPGMRRRR